MEKKSPSFVGTGIIFGFSIGIIVGLFFDQIAIGGAIGSCTGIIIGAIMDGFVKKKTSSNY
ncbi:MAG TPA: hypothetical protein VK856_14970 [Anaerolineaceae bacterium]|nr:hypothetical protein [Anaerolineaceae bacterium]